MFAMTKKNATAFFSFILSYFALFLFFLIFFSFFSFSFSFPWCPDTP